MQFTEKDLKVGTVTSLTDFDFTPEMGAMYGGRPFPLRKGESLTISLTVAEHLAKHLARQVLLRGAPAPSADGTGNGRALWTEDSLAKLISTFVRVVGGIDSPKTLTKEEILLDNAKLAAQSGIMEEETSLEENASTFKDKKEVIDELTKRGITFDARASKANLEKLLVS